MNRKSKLAMIAAFCAVALRPARAQTPQAVTLDIEFQNNVAYVPDLGDPSKAATSPNPVAPVFKVFMPNVGIADIVSVNGKSAKGSIVGLSQFVFLGPNPLSGQAIGDVIRPFFGNLQAEILQTD